MTLSKGAASITRASLRVLGRPPRCTPHIRTTTPSCSAGNAVASFSTTGHASGRRRKDADVAEAELDALVTTAPVKKRTRRKRQDDADIVEETNPASTKSKKRATKASHDALNTRKATEAAPAKPPKKRVTRVSRDAAEEVEEVDEAVAKPRKQAKKVRADTSDASEDHSDLSSYLEHAKRLGLSEVSTVFRGTHYEYTVMEALKRLGFNLKRVGGPSDLGVDLLGRWKNPATSDPLRVYVQCKALNKKSTPDTVRALEGSTGAIPQEWLKEDVLGLLVTQQKATKGVLDAIAMSRNPLGFMKVTAEGEVEQFVWNTSATEREMAELGAALRFDRAATLDGSLGGTLQTAEIILTWKGRPVSDVKPSQLPKLP